MGHQCLPPSLKNRTSPKPRPNICPFLTVTFPLPPATIQFLCVFLRFLYSLSGIAEIQDMKFFSFAR